VVNINRSKYCLDVAKWTVSFLENFFNVEYGITEEGPTFATVTITAATISETIFLIKIEYKGEKKVCFLKRIGKKEMPMTVKLLGNAFSKNGFKVIYENC
jgi:hypothetical protein